MIKIESIQGSGTITREGEECVLFVGMYITQDEVSTITTTGEIVYSVDELELVVVTKTAAPSAPAVAKEA